MALTLILNELSFVLTICLYISLLTMALILCVCKNRDKTSNTSTVLPLNSVRNGDMIEHTTHNNCTFAIPIEDNHALRCKHSTLNRALPDIPSASDTNLCTNDCQHNNHNNHNIHNNADNAINSSSNRSVKARAPQPPNNLFYANNSSVAVVTVNGVHDTHHPYARIKHSDVVDSSTENDTDDYSDLHVFNISNIFSRHDTSEHSTSQRVANNDSDSLYAPSTSSHVFVGRVQSQQMPFIASQMEDNQRDTQSSEMRDTAKTEISYNTISVREPLAKVLAERANSEHHYNEVEDERVSSFYEEIAGSTASSVTYSKIGEIPEAIDNRVLNDERREQPPEVPSLESLKVVAESSRSTSPQLLNNSELNSENILQFPHDLYSSVNKKAKTKSLNRQTIHCMPQSSDLDLENLYAKVQKCVPLVNESHSRQRPMSVNDDTRESLYNESQYNNISDSIPPPLPPPLNKSFQPRSSRTISMVDSSSLKPQTSSHQRRYSSDNYSYNEWLREQNINGNVIELDSDPGYEVIKKREVSNYENVRKTDTFQVNENNEMNPNYDSFAYDDPDSDPNYETISKNAIINSEIVEPGYEIIRRVTPSVNRLIYESNISRNLSDVSTEPGYERIRFVAKSGDESDSEPPYASINKKLDFYEDEDISERL